MMVSWNWKKERNGLVVGLEIWGYRLIEVLHVKNLLTIKPYKDLCLSHYFLI